MKKILALVLGSLISLTCHKESSDSYPVEDLKGKMLYLDQSSRLNSLDLPSGHTQLVGHTSYGAKWSNRGDRFAFVDFGNGTDLYVLDATSFDTLMKRTLKSTPGGICWSPDDTKVAYTVFNNNRVRVLDLATAAANDLVFSNEYLASGELDWSAAADALVFKTRNDSTNEVQICSIRADGSDFKVLVSGLNYDHPCFSPDGKTIAYDELWVTRIWLMDADGQNKRVFWDNADRPVWTADGSAIFATYIKSVSWTDTEHDIRIKELGGKKREGVVNSAKTSMVDWHDE